MADYFVVQSYTYLYFVRHLRGLLDILNIKATGDNISSVDCAENKEFQKLIALSRWHAVDYYLLYYFQQYPHLISADQQQQLREKMTRRSITSLRQLSELITLCQSINNRDLQYAIIKGPHLARMLYGNESVKISADLDILMVNSHDLEDFHRALYDLGYVCYEKKILSRIWKKKLYIAAKRELHYFNSTARCAVDLHVGKYHYYAVSLQKFFFRSSIPAF
jgi:hypothetical protein